jgi:hypothetical protein
MKSRRDDRPPTTLRLDHPADGTGRGALSAQGRTIPIARVVAAP